MLNEKGMLSGVVVWRRWVRGCDGGHLVEQRRVAEVCAVVLVHGVAGVHVGCVLGVANHRQHPHRVLVPTHHDVALALA